MSEVSVTNASSSSRSDSVSSGSETKRLSFLVAGNSIGGTTGEPWDDPTAVVAGSLQQTSKQPSQFGHKKTSDMHSQGFYARRIGDIRCWWGEITTSDDQSE